MPSHLHADQPAAEPPEPAMLDALITQTHRLRGGIDAVRRGAGSVFDDATDDAKSRWQRALCDLAVHHLDDLDGHLGQLRDGVPAEPEEPAAGGAAAAYGTAATLQGPGSLVSRVGSAEWNLLTDEVSWSEELYTVFGRTAADGPLSLDELPSWVLDEDQPGLAAGVTDCLIDGRPIDQEFRVVRPDGSLRTVHLVGEPLLDEAGGTASMWAVLRDVSELRRSERALGESRDSLRREQHLAQTEHRVAVELQEAVLPPWRGSLRFPQPGGTGGGSLDLASHYLPSATSALIGGDWYDALELPDGSTLLSAGDLTGHGITATSGMAMLLGAVRGMAVAGVGPGALMGHLNQLLDAAAQPALGSALCCRYDPRGMTLTWAQAGHPAPLLFRDGAGQTLQPPEGVLLGVTTGAAYEQRSEQLRPGDVLVLHTDGLAPRSTQLDPSGGDEESLTGTGRLLALAPRLTAARTAQECVRAVVEEFGDREREDDACVLVARVGD